ncbi:MAG: DsrE family protein [Planctomycetota bacterium]
MLCVIRDSVCLQKMMLTYFFVGRGVECQKINTDQFNAVEQAGRFTQSGGNVYACGTCVKSREQKESNLCPISTTKDLYDAVKASDRVVTS